MHHADFDAPASNSKNLSSGPWYAEMTRYHWFVLIVAALGWLFDCLDQQLFTFARPIAMRDLLGEQATAGDIGLWGGFATTFFILGWATGGLIFGALGDRIGRAKTMLITILIYSACTGLSALSVTVWDFIAYRFLTGLGVGGEFAVGVALVAEVMPERARARALGLLQALSAIGNISAACIGMALAPWEARGVDAWRIMFVIGALPALLVIVIRRRLKEPERWQSTAHTGAMARQRGSYAAMFGDARWRRSAIIGLLLGIPGVVGLWGIGFFAGDLSRLVLRDTFAPQVIAEKRVEHAQDPALLATLEKIADWEKNRVPGDKRTGLSDADKVFAKQVDDGISSWLTHYQGVVMLMQQLGAFPGMYLFGWCAMRFGRRPTFLVAFLGAMATTIMVFAGLNEVNDIYWMMPLMGFFQLSLFAGYAIYFSEIFPTHLRSTGTSFCYNVGRYVAAFGATLFGMLTRFVFVGEGYEPPNNWRAAGICMSSIFILGIITLLFARETKDQPLPE